MSHQHIFDRDRNGNEQPNYPTDPISYALPGHDQYLSAFAPLSSQGAGTTSRAYRNDEQSGYHEGFAANYVTAQQSLVRNGSEDPFGNGLRFGAEPRHDRGVSPSYDERTFRHAFAQMESAQETMASIFAGYGAPSDGQQTGVAYDIVEMFIVKLPKRRVMRPSVRFNSKLSSNSKLNFNNKLSFTSKIGLPWIQFLFLSSTLSQDHSVTELS
ncbi:hypothetical protein EJ02DRAFT_423339 [Clathrospora elynae]|uniref:Uncharacterized protein n=1 Tax=Clathrospora elynae TaxID=706981 RepID=A0A6A5SNR8_9PLEO|nr:hypothetical protein EJ02DRAFT_423339 [Clathrospora elynae]